MSDDLADTIEALSNQLGAALEHEPLVALSAVATAGAVVDEHRRQAVRVAAQEHSWSEIGDALGVSKQAAQQRFAKEWATELKHELKGEAVALKTALKRRDFALAAQAQERLDGIVQEFRASREANRRRRA